MAIGPRFPFATMNNFRVPDEWDHVVCICADPTGTKHCDDPECIWMHCRTCQKLMRFYASRCKSCTSFYLMVFEHPVWTPHTNLCFECCMKVTNYSSPKAAKPPLDKYRYPRQMRTPEEIAAALDEFLADW